jgi:ATP-binding cassette, subfamily B, bacterial PglK
VRSYLKKILALLTPAERRNAATLLGLMIVGMVLETLGVGLVIPAMALLMQEDIAGQYPRLQPLLETLGNPSHTELVVGGMLALVAAYLAKAVFLGYLAWRQTAFAYDLQAELSQRLFTTYLRQPYTFHLQRNSAQLIRNAITEVTIFSNSGIQPALLLMTEGLVLLGIVTLLLVVEPLGALIVAVVMGVSIAAFHQVTRRPIARWGLARQHHEGLRIQHLQEGLGGAKDVKLLGRETDFLDQYGHHNQRSARVGQYQTTLQQLPRLWLELLAVAGLAALVLTMLAQGRAMAGVVPTLGVFAAAAFRLMPSVNRSINAVQQLRYGLPVVDTLHEEIQLGAPEPRARGGGSVRPLEGEVRLEDVGYTYPGASSAALAELTLSIPRGKTVGIIGPSGSGKSTLVDVVLGLLTPSTGRVLVDGVDIGEGVRTWQDQVGYVPQSIYLTDDTLRRNVAFGLAADQIDDEAVRRAIRAAQLEEFVQTLPAGLETVVGERGVRLSGGQRQRIGIARALYHDPAVLVLDEATSALDSATEAGFMEAVRRLHGAKTILIVAHRLSTVADCDRLYRLRHGRVVEEGTPATMLAAAAAADALADYDQTVS